MKMGWGKILELLGLSGKSISSLKDILSQGEFKPLSLNGEFDSGYALGEYRARLDPAKKRTPVGELAHGFKYKYDKNSGMRLAELAVRFIKQNEEFRTADLILTVPPSFTSRPFDPVSLLAEEVSVNTDIPYRKGLIKRVRLTKLQKRTLDKRSKMQNVSGAFELIDRNTIKDKNVLLLDDLYASGATIDEVTRILKQRGAKHVFALTLIKTSWGKDY